MKRIMVGIPDDFSELVVIPVKGNYSSTYLLNADKANAILFSKHGKWLEHNIEKAHWKIGINCSDVKCSVCGGDGDEVYKYCPWCGSVIDGKDLLWEITDVTE